MDFMIYVNTTVQWKYSNSYATYQIAVTCLPYQITSCSQQRLASTICQSLIDKKKKLVEWNHV